MFFMIMVFAVITNAGITVFTLKIFESWHLSSRFMIFIGFQWTCFALQALVMFVVDDEPDFVGVQKARTEFLVAKLIDKIPDANEDTMSANVEEAAEEVAGRNNRWAIVENVAEKVARRKSQWAMRSRSIYSMPDANEDTTPASVGERAEEVTGRNNQWSMTPGSATQNSNIAQLSEIEEENSETEEELMIPCQQKVDHPPALSPFAFLFGFVPEDSLLSPDDHPSQDNKKNNKKNRRPTGGSNISSMGMIPEKEQEVEQEHGEELQHEQIQAAFQESSSLLVDRVEENVYDGVK